mmetsp:Transcript_33981/g.55414  ORF Transcript_33981/g.55414 Transcript_33981/m.55414 type:complete len:526 (-) Transcript_33981:60-1637(-)
MTSFLIRIFLWLFVAVYGKEIRETTFITPRVSSDGLTISFNDFVEQKTAVWKISLPYDESAVYYDEQQTPQWGHLNAEAATQAMIAAQVGMNIQVTISSELGFKAHKSSTLVLSVNGEVPLKHKNETDMILVLYDPQSEQYISSVTRFDNGDRWEYPQCNQALASGDVLQMADGTDFRLWKVSCPADSEGVLQCYQQQSVISDEFPVSLSVTNDPRWPQVAYQYTNNHGISDAAESCIFSASNFTANEPLNFFISADGAGDDEGLRISNISVTRIYCDDDPEWISNYHSNANGASAFHLQLTDACDDDTTIRFIFQTITTYAAEADGDNGVVSHVETGAWQGEQHVTAYGEASLDARENIFVAATGDHRLSVEMLIIDEETAIYEQELSVGDLKFTLYLESAGASSMLSEDYTTKICLMIEVLLPMFDGAEEETDEWQDASSVVLGRVLRLQNDNTAQCEDIDGDISDIPVTATRKGYEVCYAFGACGGRILYDPFVYYEEDDSAYRPIHMFWLSTSIIAIFFAL